MLHSIHAYNSKIENLVLSKDNINECQYLSLCCYNFFSPLRWEFYRKVLFSYSWERKILQVTSCPNDSKESMNLIRNNWNVRANV
jgi:hypothetical protein